MEKVRIGKSNKGKVIHFIINKNNRALCEKKQVGLVELPEMSWENITCKRCMKSAAYTISKLKDTGNDAKTDTDNAIPIEKVPDIKTESVQKCPEMFPTLISKDENDKREEKIQNKEEDKENEKEKVEQEETSNTESKGKKDEDETVILPPPDSQVAIELYPDEELPQEEQEYDEDCDNDEAPLIDIFDSEDLEQEIVEKPAFYKKKTRKGKFKIVHQASEKIFFNKIDGQVIDIAIKLLNDIPIKWKSQQDQIPNGFISECRITIAAAYLQAHAAVPKSLATIKKEEKPKRIISRRDKKKTKGRKIKRRKKNKKSTGKGPTHFDFALTEMKEGATLSQIGKNIADEFGFTEKKGLSKVKKAIRKMRKTNVTITIETATNKLDDFYKIKNIL